MPPRQRAPMLYGVHFFCVCALGLAIAALVTREWYIIEQATTKTTFGVYETCVDGKCDKIDYKGFTIPKCSRTGGELQTRVHAVFGLMIGGGACALVVFFLACFAGSSRLAMGLSLTLLFLGFGAFAAGDILYPFTLHKYYFCDEPFCDSMFDLLGLTGKCVSFFGYSYALAIVAGACMWTALVMLVQVACCGFQAAPAEPTVVSHPEAAPAPAPAASKAPTNQTANRTTAEAPHGRNPPSPQANTHAAGAGGQTPSANAPPEGMEGWELDANTGLYWSDTEKLFYDAASGHFYDPKSELWYDPTTQQWYQGSDQ